MPIPFKAPLSSQKANETFVDATIDSIKKNKLTLYKVNIGDAETIDDVQNFINEIADTTGQIGENDPGRKTYTSQEIIADGDDRKAAIGKLDAQAKINLDKNDSQDLTLIDHENRIVNNETIIANHETRIGTNETEIQAIEDSVGAANGICPLDATTKVSSIYLPSYVDDVLEFADLASFPVTGEAGKIYVALDTNKQYRWSGTVYSEVSPSDVNSVNGKTGIVVLDKTDIGLTNVTDDAQLKRTANDFDTFTEKAEPVEDDIVLIEDSEDLGNKKKVKLENLLGGGGAGGSTAWIDGDIAPLSGYTNGIETKDFDNESGQEMFINVIVPDNYSPGNQIKLLNAKFFADNSADNVLIKCETVLIKNGDDVTTNTNNHISTNTEITLSTANALVNIGEIDLSDATGQINSVAVAIGDLLIVKLYRDYLNETSSAVEDAKVLKYSATVSFKG